MRIACIGDIHLINPEDPRQDLVEQRSFFIRGQESLRHLFRALEQEAPDYVVFLGDLVDWASIENISYAVDFLHTLKLPWHALPGNHDFQNPDKSTGALQGRALRTLWQEHGMAMDNQRIDCDDFSLILVDNALSNLEAETLSWLDQAVQHKAFNLVCQHVPIDLPENRAAIHAVAPDRNFNKYVCSAQPDLFDSHYRGRVQAVASGHVHISATVKAGACTHYLCNVGIELKDTNRGETAQASATILSFNGTGFDSELITV